MSKASKTVVTIVLVLVFILLFSVVAGVSHDNGGRTTGVFGLILVAGLIGGLRAIWKIKRMTKTIMTIHRFFRNNVQGLL